ncbi:MAG TPA: universal stress protein [Acidimicrobiales bacterium]|nr:universal stress protein [Acidimicrobiales bacterium]
MAPDTIHQCPLCELRFAHRTELSHHVAVDHPTAPDDDLPPPWRIDGLVTVPLDPAHATSPALPVGVALARQGGFGVELVAAPAPGLPTAPYLTARHRDLAAAEVPTAPPRELVGRPADAIVAHAAGGATRLLCLATHARGPLAARALGSVSTDVVRRSPVPVVLVGPVVRRTGVPIRRVLVGIDGSLLAEQALEIAADLGERLGADLELVEVATPMRTGGDVPAGADLRHAVESLATPPRSYEVLHGRDAARVLADHAGTAGDTLLVVGTHGRTGVERAVLGGIALHLARHAACPVLVVPRTAVPAPPLTDRGTRV